MVGAQWRSGSSCRYPAGLAATPAYFGPLAVCALAGRAGGPWRSGAELAVLAVIVALVGVEAAAPAGLIAVGSSVLALNGFADHRFGELGWQPGTDLRVTVLLGCVWAAARAARVRPAADDSTVDTTVLDPTTSATEEGHQ